MKVSEKSIKGVMEFSLRPVIDERGFVMRAHDKQIFHQNGIKNNWVQENHSHSNVRGVVRGLRFQFPPFTEAKLIRVVRGAIIDVCVDLRRGSSTFGQWVSTELSEVNKRMVLIPRGFAHGFCTLTDACDVLYKVDNYYNPDSEGGIIWSDKILNIPWPVTNPILSAKDANLPSFQDFVKTCGGIEF